MNTSAEDDVLEVNLAEILYHLIHKFWIILLVGVICAVPVFIYMECISTPVYTSTTSFMVYVQEDLNAEYAALATSSEVIQNSLEELQLGCSEEQLRSKIRAWIQGDAKIMYISVTDSDPEQAKIIADTVRNYTIDLVKESRGIEHTRVMIVANVPRYRDGVPIKWMTLFAGGVGACIAACVVVFLALVRKTICTPEDVEKYVGLETLGIIPIETD